MGNLFGKTKKPAPSRITDHDKAVLVCNTHLHFIPQSPTQNDSLFVYISYWNPILTSSFHLPAIEEAEGQTEAIPEADRGVFSQGTIAGQEMPRNGQKGVSAIALRVIVVAPYLQTLLIHPDEPCCC